MQGLYRPLPLYSSLDEEDDCKFDGASDSELRLGVVIFKLGRYSLKNQLRFYTFIVKALGIVLDRGLSFSAIITLISNEPLTLWVSKSSRELTIYIHIPNFIFQDCYPTFGNNTFRKNKGGCSGC